MAAALDARNQEAIHHQLAFTDFLELLVEDELARRRDRLFARRLKQSHIPGVKNLENFDRSFNPRIHRNPSSWIWPPLASSVSMPACFCSASGRVPARATSPSRWQWLLSSPATLCSTSAFQSRPGPERGAGYRGTSRGHRWPHAGRPAGARRPRHAPPPTHRRRGTGEQVFVRRYEKGAIIVTSNRPVEDWGKVLGDTSLPALSSTVSCITPRSSSWKEEATACTIGNSCTKAGWDPEPLTEETK